jgi:EamA domain-containing membrane protein RarD
MPDHQLEVGRTKLPLNSYDLLGYLGPGTTLLASVFLFEFWARERLHLSIVAPVYSIVFNLWPERVNESETDSFRI